MNRSALRRTSASFLFLLLSLTALAAAVPARSVAGLRVRSSRGQSIVSFVWNALNWLWAKEGGSLDPSGKPQPGVTPNAGGSLDPDGILGEAGSSLDPSGAK